MESRPLHPTQRDPSGVRLELGDLRWKRELWWYILGTPPISHPAYHQSHKHLNTSLSQDDVAVRPAELACRLVLQLYWTTVDKVRQLRPGLPGGTLFRHRSSRGRKLSLSLCLLLPVRRGEQDPCPGLVCAIAIPVFRAS